MKSHRSATRLYVCGILLLAVSSCSEESLREFLHDYTAHERYEQVLLAVGLDQTALGRDWISAATAALDSPVTISAPHREESYLDPREAVAIAYRIPLRRGQRLGVAFESEPDSSYQVFIDLFLIHSNSDRAPRRLASVDSLARTLDYLARRDGDYLIRIQPELLRGGRYSIEIVVTPSLAFPVSGHDATAIGSWYGDSRDAGRRRHEGLDIFAPRGTPVLAAANGVVRSTRRNRLGGNVVWLRDEFGRSHYYAHLDTQVVRRGQRLHVGDTLGLVGNSGNARTTPPHLHFGLYSSGSFDPYPALQQLPTTPASFTGDPDVIGRAVRVVRDRSRIRSLPTARSSIIAELPLHTPLRVEAGSGDWYRVVTPDGIGGYVAARLTEPADRPIRSELLTNAAVLLTDPDSAGMELESVGAGFEVPVLGAFGGFLLVQGPSGRAGWLPSN
ncbi:MAG: M23 family metallopeptidase [Gemmatimonadales bacterium]|jgi:murein DD-endopeptidase MepM/ murein hydrolase activator NlpD